MSFFARLRQQKLLSMTLLMVTLSVGIVIGTLINTGVRAKSSSPAPDATPLVIPPPTVLSNEFSKLARRLEPSVVNISTDYTAKATRGRRNPSQEEDEEDPMDLFRRFFRNHPNEQLPRRFRRREGTGSGFIVDKNGYIITNWHVVESADHIKVKMPHDDSEYRARLIGYDEETDLAVIKIDVGRPLVPVKIGNSDSVQTGEWAIAIGSPFGLEASVTAGIISATGRDIGGKQFQRFIQTDAAINPGNSGPPLLNINGEVIGINTAIATVTGAYQGVGFALPINTAVTVYNSIIKTGRMTRGSIGITFKKYDRSQELLKALGLKEGVVVEGVTPGGPAEKAGIKPEDVIVAYNGKPVKDGDDLVSRVAASPVGSQATITVDRNGKRMDFKVTIADREEQLKAAGEVERRPEERSNADPGSKGAVSSVKFGISIRPLNDSERQNAGLEENRGVVITQVQEGSFAEEIGLQERDIIVSINRQPITSIDDVRRIQSTLKPGSAVAFRVLRPEPAAMRSRGATPYVSFYVSGTLPTGE
jgi:serine protease Do